MWLVGVTWGVVIFSFFFVSSWSHACLCRATHLFFRSSECSLPRGAMLNFQWPVWESESDNTKCNTPAPPSHLRLGLCDMTIYIGWTKLKVYRFILCSIVYIVVSQNTLLPVIPFHYLSDCDLYMPPNTRRGETERPARTKRGARS